MKDAPSVEAIKDISITLPDRGIVFFVGRSGSGKSTLLNLLGGLDQPNQGSIEINDQDITQLSSKELDVYRSRYIGFIFQDFNLIESLSVKDNIELSTELKGETTDLVTIKESLHTVDLDGYENRLPNTLSSGQRQRVAIARALIKKPKVILADEPTGSLDLETSVQIFSLLKQLSAHHLVIVVSHDLESAKSFADRIIELKDGTIASDRVLSENAIEITQTHESKHVGDHHQRALPIKRAIQLAYHYLKLKKTKLALTLIITLLTFMLFGLFDALGNYNVTKNSLKSMYDKDQTTIVMQKSYRFDLNDESGQFIHLSFDDLEKMQEKYPGSTFIPIMKGYRYNHYNSLFDTELIDLNRFMLGSEGGISVTPEIINTLGYEVIYGHLPEDSHQILVTLYMFEIYKSFDYKTPINSRIHIDTYDDLVGLSISIGEEEFEIVGILDTKLDLTKFEPIFNETELSTIEKNSLFYEYRGTIESGLHQYIYMHEDVIDNYKFLLNDTFDLTFTSKYTSMTFNTDDDLINDYGLDKLSKFTSDNHPESIIWVNEELSELSDYQVILPTYAINQNTVTMQEVSTMRNTLIDQFVLDHYAEIQTEFETNESMSYGDYIRQSIENVYHPGYTIFHFHELAFIDWIQSSFDNDQSGHVSIDGLFESTKDIEIVGFYLSVNSGNINLAFFSEAFYNELIEENFFYPLYGAVVTLSQNKFQDTALLNEMTEKEGTTYYFGTNPILTTAEYYDKVLGDFSEPLLYVGLGLAMISMLQLISLIASSIAMKKKEIGILRAMGARIKDILKIFYSESLMIGMISAVAAILLNLLMMSLANAYFMYEYATPLKLLIFGYRQFFIIFGIVIVSTVISTLLPVYFYAKKNPIDTIRLL
jgi:ABC-type lipoprotein export system ATPase subunit